MEDEERQKKLEAGKAKLAEYRQKKAHADSQKKQKKKKKRKNGDDLEGASQDRGEADPDPSVDTEEIFSGGLDGMKEGVGDPPTTEFTFAKTLRGGESVKHDQTYTIEPESEVSTTAEDYSSEEEVDVLQQLAEGDKIQDMEDVKMQTVEELNQELEEMRATFGTEEVQQLQDFEAALKQRDGIITQLTANLQQAREEKDEIMKEFLKLTEQSQNLQIQFQQLQAGETLRNTSHSSTAADLLQARQQLVQYQQQLEEVNMEVTEHRERSSEQLKHISQLQHQLNEMEMTGKRSEENFMQTIKEKELLITNMENVISARDQMLLELRTSQESFAQTLEEKSLVISEQTAIITQHERSLASLREEFVNVRRTDENVIQQSDEKDSIIAEKNRIISEQECSLSQLRKDTESSEKCLRDVQQQLAAGESELLKCQTELENTKSELDTCRAELVGLKEELVTEKSELESCQIELSTSKQKERMSSNEIMQLMATVEELQRRCHQGSVTESDTVQQMQEENTKKLELLRAELDEEHGQQIVQMKHEINLQHLAKVEQMTQQHSTELEFLKGQLSQSSSANSAQVESLNAKMKVLQETLEQTQATHNQSKLELNHIAREKQDLEVKVENLLKNLHSANEKVELVSHCLKSQESQQDEAQSLQETIDSLKSQLAAAQEASQEAEVKHESEVTNYKIKLEMLEREKDAVLDRMAESQEAELERLRTQLLFSHEEELTYLREDLQRENFMNTENLLNEAAIKHQKVLDELRLSYEEELTLTRSEKESFASERDELLQQILSLKEDLSSALQNSKADELVEQLQELQVELEELRKGGEERVRLENEVQTLLNRMDVLKKEMKVKEESWELEKKTLTESHDTLKEELSLKCKEIDTLTVDNNQFQQKVDALRQEIQNQKTTFSFAEKNFEVNYQELKEEYMCLVKAKTHLEDKALRETLEFETKITRLESEIEKLETRRETHTVYVEKDTTELMEKLKVTLNEKEKMTDHLSEVNKELWSTQNKVEQLEEELTKVRKENTEVMTNQKRLEKVLQENHEQMQKKEASEDSQTRSLQEEIKALQSLLQAAEAERDEIRQTLDLQQLPHPPSAATIQSSREGPVEGQSSVPERLTAASQQNRRKKRQKSKQPSSSFPGSRGESQREEEEEASAAASNQEERRATSAAAQKKQNYQMKSQVVSHSQQRARTQGSTKEHRGDRENTGKQVKRAEMNERHTDPAISQRAAEKEGTTKHAECRLQMEAQRLSLSQLHSAQLELLQEESDALTHAVEQRVQSHKVHSDPEEPTSLEYHHLLHEVKEECIKIILCYKKMFGEEILEKVTVSEQVPSEVRPQTSEFTSTVLETRELYQHLQQVRERMEQEQVRLSQLQAELRAEENKIMEMHKAYDELKSSSEKEICDLRVQVAAFTSIPSKGPEESDGTPSTSMTQDLQRLKEEAQEKHLQQEQSHKQEMERLRAHFQQEATEAEERYATELLMLQQRLQEVTGTQDQHSVSMVSESGSEKINEHSAEDLSEDALSEENVSLGWSHTSPGLSVKLQALRKALYNKYVQEVATLKEQHSVELRRLREEREQEERRREERQKARGEKEQGLDLEEVWAAEEDAREEKHYWERVEEEVAKAIVQISVEFAQQTEMARINKHACQASTSMQTQSCEEEMEERESEEQTPRDSFSPGAWLEEVEREKLEKELEEKNAEIQRLTEELQRAGGATDKTLKKQTHHEGEVEEEEDPGGLEIKESYAQKLSSPSHDITGSSHLDVERDLLRKANEKLSQVLVDVLKTTAAAEETMGLHMQNLSDVSLEQQCVDEPDVTSHRASSHRVNAQTFSTNIAGHTVEDSHEAKICAEDLSLWSRETGTDEGLEASQQMVESLLLGAETQLENEEFLMCIGGRLQSALERMLMTISETTNQLEHARLTQTELMRESFRHNQEINELLQKQEELQERLTEEARAREDLALELHRAEGLIDGYTDERAALEEQLRQKEELQMSLEQELQVTSSRLQELEQDRLQMQEERELLSRQQDAMREHAGSRELRLVEAAMVAAPEADLLEETEKLMKEKVEVQRQAEKENLDLLKQVKLLEAELEEQVNRVIELEQARRTESGDLQQQIQALEKQLDKNRKFLDEQAVDREHERDFFQQEIQKLEKQLKNPQKVQTGSEQRNQEVDQLTSQLKEKADWCSELLLSSEQLRRDLKERDEEIDKLESRIRELEQALLASADSLEKAEQKKQHASITESRQSVLEAQLQTEREALERKEKEICNLEEQLEQFREELENKSEEVQQLHMQLEIQRKEISSQQEYLETRDSMLQVMEEKDREIALLNEQISKLRHTETASNNKELDGKEDMIKDLECLVQCLHSEQDHLKRNHEEELDQLNAVIDKLQQELVNIEQKRAVEEDEDQEVKVDHGPCQEDYDELKQKLDSLTRELDTLQTEHIKLLETHQCLKENADVSGDRGKVCGSEEELESALREKTAGLVVMQAQVQALEQSATSRGEEFRLRIQELEDLVTEKDKELSRCQLLVEQTQSYRDVLQQKVSDLEDNLREKMASALVSQATLEALQQQNRSPASTEVHGEQEHKDSILKSDMDLQSQDFGVPRIDFRGLAQTGQTPSEKVVCLTQTLRDLEAGLKGMQKDHEIQKQLLSSSEEEVVEYERRLAACMDLLSQMKPGTQQETFPATERPSAHDQPAVSELSQELEEVKKEASAAKEQLHSYEESCCRLQEELHEKNVTIKSLEDQLQQVVTGGSEQVQLQQELLEARDEATAAKEDLSSCRESLEKLQELLQEREMTIARLKGELFQVESLDGAVSTELLQELQEVRDSWASTKEELNRHRQQNEKLQEDLQSQEASISKFKEEQLQLLKDMDTTREELSGYKMQNEKLQEELKLHESSFSKLKEEPQQLIKEFEATKQELSRYKKQNEALQQQLEIQDHSSFKLKEELHLLMKDMETNSEELRHYRQQNEKLEEELKLQKISLSKPEQELQKLMEGEVISSEQHSKEMRAEMEVLKVEPQQLPQELESTDEVTSSKEQNEKLLRELQAPDVSISKLQEMLQELMKELDFTKEELTSYKQQNEKLQDKLRVQELSISKLKVEGAVDKVSEDFGQENRKLQEEDQVQVVSMPKPNERNQELVEEMDSTKKQLDSYRQQNDKLQEELHNREISISKLKEELQQLEKEMETTKEELSSYRRPNEKPQVEQHVQDLSATENKAEPEQVQKGATVVSSSDQQNGKSQKDLQVSEVSLWTGLDTTSEELSGYKAQNEELKKELEDRELSITELREELQKLEKEMDTTKGELDNLRLQIEKPQEEQQVQQHEEEPGQETDIAPVKEVSSSNQQNEKLQEELQVQEVLISNLNHEHQQLTKQLDTTNEELTRYRMQNEKLQEELITRETSISKMKGEHEELLKELDTTKEELSSYRQQNEKLQAELQVQEHSSPKPKEDPQQLQTEVDTANELRSYKEESEKLQEELQVQEVSISKLKEERQLLEKELDTTNEELVAQRTRNEKLQEELHAGDISNSKLQEEFQQLTEKMDTTKEELSRYKQQNEELQEHVQELSMSKPKEPTAADMTEDEEVSSYRQEKEELQKALQVQDISISKLEEELQQFMRNENSTKEELSSYRQQNQKLQEELHIRDVSISNLNEELQRLQTTLMKTADSGLVSPSASLHPQSSASSSSTTQPKRKTSKQPATKGSSAKDKLSLPKKNSSSSSQSSYKSHSSRQNSSSEQQHVAVTDSFTQTEPLQTPDMTRYGTSVTKEEMDEVIGDFQEKIVQMQELHAAEILDMEARHISESENLRRDTHALEDECKALKAVIDKLRSSEAPASRQDRPVSLFRDGYTSDSSSDYSQRTGYELPSLQQEFRTTPEGARRETDDPMPDRIKMLLREVHQEGMQVLSLSELPLSEGVSSNQFNVQGWMKERDALLDTVESLKGLITQMKTNMETQGVDWRSQLLDAVRQVFLKERSVLKNMLYSQLDLLDTRDAIVHLNQLERRLAEQDTQHRDAMSSLHTAERSSLIAEVHQLRGQLEQLHHGANTGEQPTMASAAECSRKEQREGGGRGGETDGVLVEELRCELSQTKLELETTLKTQHKHLKELDTLRAEVTKKAAEAEALGDQLTEEKRRSRDLQWSMEKEKCRSGRTEENKQEELEDLQISLEEQKTQVAQLTLTLDREREASSLLVQESEQKSLKLQRNLQELQVQLETERAKALEISSALGRERELRTGASFDHSSSNEVSGTGDQEDGGRLMERLQNELDDKHAQVVHLLSQVEAQKLEVVRKDGELNLVNQRWKRDQETLLEAQAQLQRLGAQLSDSQQQMETEVERRRRVEEEKERVEERLARAAELRGQTQAGGVQQADGSSPSPWQRDSTDRTSDWVYQQKYGNIPSPTSSISPQLMTSPAAHTSGQHPGPWNTVDKIVNKLHLVSSKIHHLSTQSPGRASAEVDKEELSWMLSNMEEVVSMLQQNPPLPSMSESLPLVAAGSSSAFNSLAERLLRQNAELTGFVSRLTEEKNDLRNQVLRLEEELRYSRKSVLGSGDSSYGRRAPTVVDSNTLLLSHERESWAREKSCLEKSLQVAQSQVARLRSEIRSDTLRDITGPEGDNAALKRMYGRYLRSESFRKALIYQKKYLLLLLGGFQECEEATLSLLARMGGQPSLSSLDSYSQRRGGLMRFRSAVRVSIALSRMRYLVRRWHKATGMVSSPSCSLSKNGTTNTLGTDVRDSPYLHPGSVEMYREKGSERGGEGGGGVSSLRGRSGRESPRSAVSSTHHRFHMSGDHGPLTCSHLQSYDPDRALTDYISRLEALQRRLGSVTSGASSYTHLHYGLRR